MFEIDFNLRVLSNGTIALKSGDSALLQKIIDILLTKPGESLFNPDFGSDIMDFLNSFPIITNAIAIKDACFISLKNNLENVKIGENDIQVLIDRVNKSYEVTIKYETIDSSVKKSIVFDLITKR